MSSRSGPRHLAGPRTSASVARNRSLAVAFATLLLLVLSVAAVRAIGARGSRPASKPAAVPTTAGAPSPPATDATGNGSAVAPGSTTPTVTTVPRNLVGNPGFESGLSGWQPIGGARIELADGHQGSSGIKLTRGSARDPGVAYPAVTTTAAKGDTYVATAWVRPSAPGVVGEIRLLEYVEGRRFASFESGLDLRDTRWQRLQVAQLVHVKGSTLALEVLAPGLPARAALLVDDVTVRLAR